MGCRIQGLGCISVPGGAGKVKRSSAFASKFPQTWLCGMQSRLRSASGLFSCRESKETWHGLCPCIPALPGVWSARSVAPNSRWPQPGVRDCTDRAVYLCPLVGRTHTHTHTHTHKHTQNTHDHTYIHTCIHARMHSLIGFLHLNLQLHL